ncbi:MAG: DUF4416 family protein [Candidatus Aminicenantes bacterium]|nr:DUF4416 family protein [Candidatus Aminicenantes bacterium]
MAEAIPFKHVKLICGIIASREDIFQTIRTKLEKHWGEIDGESFCYPFDFTDYYEKQMGKGLKRKFYSFKDLIKPDGLARLKILTNRIEKEMKNSRKSELRVVNIDPGYLTASALILATAKDFAHRVPLEKGIYAHIEFLFGKKEVRLLEWTYPDYRNKKIQDFFLDVRKKYLKQI